MTDPSKVQGFLDFAGGSRWDPSLAFVMAGAILVHVVMSRLIRRRKAPLFAARFALPTRTDLDPKLIVGAALFGVGWGIGGICPGPGLVDLGSGMGSALVFVVAMAAGMLLQKLTAREEAPNPQPTPTHEVAR
ncbi:MAG: YeeE/YedE family protein [Deltaproteobacteria bacterium]|nr:YeeE/YedE family protein [Deltaproteobacteria bacterium]